MLFVGNVYQRNEGRIWRFDSRGLSKEARATAQNLLFKLGCTVGGFWIYRRRDGLFCLFFSPAIAFSADLCD